MASIGLMGFWFGEYGETDGKMTITNGKKIGKGCNAEVTYQKASATLYADNGKDDEVNVITGVSLTITPNDTNGDDIQEIIGYIKNEFSINEQTDQMYSIGSNTATKFYSTAWIKRVRESGIERHKVHLFSKTRWSLPDSETAQSLQESMSFNTESVMGTGFADINGNYVYTKVYDKEEEAIKAIEKLFGISKEE